MYSIHTVSFTQHIYKNTLIDMLSKTYSMYAIHILTDSYTAPMYMLFHYESAII
jgi:hypothetical protein